MPPQQHIIADENDCERLMMGLDDKEFLHMNELNALFMESLVPSSMKTKNPETHQSIIIAERNERQREVRAFREVTSDKKASVHFGSVQIRKYNRTLGDNPACSCGSPTSLGWNYTTMDPISLDQYEGDRGPLRGRRNLKMTPITRRNILHNQWGYTHEEIDAAAEKIKVIRRQREKSKKTSSSPGKDAVRAIGKKIKRTLSKERLLNASMFMTSPMIMVRH